MGQIGIVLLVLIFIFQCNRESEQHQQLNDKIDANLVMGIARVKSSSKYGLTYTYYHNHTKYHGYFDRYSDRSKVGRYFRLEYSAKDPKLSRLDADYEIEEDSARIVVKEFRQKTLTEILDAK